MRPRLLIILVGLASIALVGVGLWWKGGLVPRPTERRERPAAEPELSLSVNGSTRPTVTPGTPVVFEVMLRNGLAARAVGEAPARERLRKELDELVQSGELSRHAADAVLNVEPIPSAVPPMVVTVAAEGFSFRRDDPQGAPPLPWQPKMVDPASPAVVTLDEKRIAKATFVVAPEATVAAPKEAYRMRAHFENRASGQWQGKIASNPVVITIVKPPEAPTADEQKKQYLLLGEYFLARKDYEGAIQAARQALIIVPQSIDGLVLLGKAQEAKGEFRPALDAYERALAAFDRRHPHADHPPLGLMLSIRRMEEKLGISPSPAGEEPAPPAR